MATELTVQSERAFQKQPHIFLNSKVKSKSKKVGKGGRRWYKDVGLGFKTPKTAIEGSYIVPIHWSRLHPWPYPDRAPLSPPRCTVPSSSAGNTFTTSPSTTVMRRDTRTLPLTFLPHSVLKKVTRSRWTVQTFEQDCPI
ncbi:40S ribosomal protein S11 [Coccidioides immitis RMSCC 3703]|uniref:40S ribosomal protein S11 n=1 Tax=Coccidioides immitis RMSCC 3703 TaxID=454286 RepID=A0A0J8R6A0_COCIT|nr:40S ribosomal protein S11 [Coccidioides immitis RMSCC 3703]